MNGGPRPGLTGAGAGAQSLFPLFGSSHLPKRTTSLERFTVSKYPGDADQLFQACEKMTDFVWARCQQVDVFLRSFVFPPPEGQFAQNRILFLDKLTKLSNCVSRCNETGLISGRSSGRG